jgi:hypothetical protein
MTRITCKVRLDSVDIKAAAGHQLEGFPVVPDYKVTKTESGFVADYISTVSNYGHGYKRFEAFLPFTAKLTLTFPAGGQLHILNASGPGLIPKDPSLCSSLPQLRQGLAD